MIKRNGLLYDLLQRMLATRGTMCQFPWTGSSWLQVGGTLLLLVLFLSLSHAPLYASDPCNPPNQIPQPVCDMDSFHGDPPRQVPDGWSEFVIYGEPSFMNDPHSFFGSGTLRIWSNGGTFKAGIFTQVNVTPGAGYRASIAWGAPNAPDTIGRQLGTDLTLPEVIRIGYNHGLVESTTVSVDTTWSAIKFTHPKPGKEYRNSYGQLLRKSP